MDGVEMIVKRHDPIDFGPCQARFMLVLSRGWAMRRAATLGKRIREAPSGRRSLSLNCSPDQ